MAGGAARGAYEVGVIRYILEDIARELGREVPLDVLCGTSVGALNSTFLAAAADDPRGRGARLEREWLSLRMTDVIHPDPRAGRRGEPRRAARPRRPAARRRPRHPL
jgi:NTE family protein